MAIGHPNQGPVQGLHPIHHYEYPTKGDLDAGTNEVNARAAPTNSAADIGRSARVTGTSRWYIWTGTSWDEITNAGMVSPSRLLTAGAGLTGGGDLSADRTFDVVANGDGSIVVNANDVQVGVLATDAQHGARGGGTQHAAATTSVAGFMSGADKTKLDGLPSSAVPTTRTLTAGVGLSGGGDLSADRSFAIDVNGLTVDGTPDGAADYVATYDASAATHKKVLLNDLPGGTTPAKYDVTFQADALSNADSANWSINANAPIAADAANAALTVRLFDDTTEEGPGFILSVPSGATTLRLDIKSRAVTAPGAAQTVALTLHYREIADNGAVGAWVQYDLTNISIPTNANWQYDTQTITLATLSMNAGSVYQFQFTRNAAVAGDTLVGDWALLELNVQFNVAILSEALFYADQLDSPTSADWAISVAAPSSVDTVNAALRVRRFDDTTEEAVGFLLATPATATQLTIVEKSRAQTAPGSPQTVARTLRWRKIPDNGAVAAWSALDLTDISMPANTNFQYDTQTLTFATLGVDPGALYQWQLSRDTADAGDTLVGDWSLLEVGVRFA